MDLTALPAADQTELQRLEEGMWQQAVRYNHDFQQRRFASDFLEIGRSGRVYTRAQAMTSDSQPIRAQLPLPNLRLRLLDVNTVQLTYDSAVEHNGVVEYTHRSSLWYRSPNGWVLRFHQGTPYQP